MATNEASGLAVVVGSAIRQWREQRGETADEIARRFNAAGLDWTRGTVAHIENGSRDVTLDEFVVMCLALKVTAASLLDGDADVVLSAPDGRTAARTNLSTVRVVLASPATLAMGNPGPPPKPKGTPEQRAIECAKGEAEQKAARKLGVDPVALSSAAIDLWGRCLTDERDSRLAQSPSGSQRAQRGHITRALLSELAPTLQAEGQR